jgi:capsid protein
MPLLMVRLDSSKHNYSSARLDTQTYNRMILGIQCWLSGTPNSTGTLNRLVDLVAAEARFTDRRLRKRPAKVEYVWTWAPRPHVDPKKEADAEEMGLRNRTLSFAQALAARGRNLDTHIHALQREQAMLEESGIALPEWLTGAATAPSAEPGETPDPDEQEATTDEQQEEPANANA